MQTVMNNRKRVGYQSALLVSAGAIGISFGGSILAWWAGFGELGFLLLAVGVIGLVSRLWGFYALRHVEVTVAPRRETISAGQSVSVRYTIQNRKALPLVWLELCHDVPVRGCLVPDDTFRLSTFTPEEAEYSGRKEAYMRRMSFVKGWSEQEWETVWTGVRRGVYRPQDFILRSGDGFGLTQSIGEAEGSGGRMMVVWPRIVSVETGPFLRNIWSGSSEKAGWSEDPSVVKGIHAYQPGDPWKRIDWRVAARTDELMVRQFDTVTPLNILFILDAASLEDREEGISVLASLILSLSRHGVACGLALPSAGGRLALVLCPEDPAVTMEQCLFALTEFDAEEAGKRFDERAIMASSITAGQIWMIAGSAARISCPELANRLSRRGVRLITEVREPGFLATAEYTLSQLRRKEARP